MRTVEICKARSDQNILGMTRSCTLSNELGEKMNVTPLCHIRIDSEDRSMYCMVKNLHSNSDCDLRMPKDTRTRFGFDPGQNIRISSVVPNDSYKQARRNGGFAETVWDDPDQDRFLIIAQHGGDIEFGTDDVAIRLFRQMDSEGLPCSVWMCHGFNSSFRSDAFKNWHISKPCKSIESYPGLRRVASRRYDYTVSVHMQGKDRTREDSKKSEYYIGVGGRISDEIRFEIANKLRDLTGKTIETDLDEMKFAGQDSMNSANYLSVSGSSLQLELTPRTAYIYRKKVAKSIFDVFSKLL